MTTTTHPPIGFRFRVGKVEYEYEGVDTQGRMQFSVSGCVEPSAFSDRLEVACVAAWERSK